MASIRDISRKTGLGISTISRYINKSGYVSQESAELIQNVIDELGYVPNRNAQAIFNKKSGSIGLLFPNLVNPFFAELATILGNLIQKDGYGCVLCFTEDDLEKEEAAIDLLNGYRVDGVISTRGRDLEKLLPLSVPAVSFETRGPKEIITVSADNYGGGRMALEHLLATGCRKLLHISGPKRFEATEDRRRGFQDAAQDHNIAVDILQLSSDYLLDENFDQELGLLNYSNYDGIFVFNDINSIYVINYLRKKGFSIPQDLQIIGFDNSYLSGMYLPSLTTIEQSPREIAETMYRCLKEQMEGNIGSTEDRVVPVRLVKRDSTLQEMP